MLGSSCSSLYMNNSEPSVSSHNDEECFVSHTLETAMGKESRLQLGFTTTHRICCCAHGSSAAAVLHEMCREGTASKELTTGCEAVQSCYPQIRKRWRRKSSTMYTSNSFQELVQDGRVSNVVSAVNSSDSPVTVTT